MAGETIGHPKGEEVDPLVNLTGERIAFGRGRLQDILTVETNRTGPLTPPTNSSSSSSVLLEDSLPDSLDSLPLDELEPLEEEVELPLPIFLALVMDMRGGMLVAVVGV